MFPSKKIFKNIFSSLKNYEACHSYSQSGEDLIVNFILNTLRISQCIYLDVGAHHPVYLSNTYFFYKKGGQGVCVESEPSLCKEIKKKRPRDICLNIGIGANQETQADFYVMTTRTLNTFSKEEAERYQSYGSCKIERVIKIPLFSINNIIAENFSSCPNFVSLDVEGLDLKILNTFDFLRFRPEVFCIETLTYTEDKSERKIMDISDLMIQNNYFIYADTYINTIFVDKDIWKNRL